MPQFGASLMVVNYAPRVTNYALRVVNYAPREQVQGTGMTMVQGTLMRIGI